MEISKVTKFMAILGFRQWKELLRTEHELVRVLKQQELDRVPKPIYQDSKLIGYEGKFDSFKQEDIQDGLLYFINE